MLIIRQWSAVALHAACLHASPAHPARHLPPRSDMLPCPLGCARTPRFPRLQRLGLLSPAGGLPRPQAPGVLAQAAQARAAHRPTQQAGTRWVAQRHAWCCMRLACHHGLQPGHPITVHQCDRWSWASRPASTTPSTCWVLGMTGGWAGAACHPAPLARPAPPPRLQACPGPPGRCTQMQRPSRRKQQKPHAWLPWWQMSRGPRVNAASRQRECRQTPVP